MSSDNTTIGKETRELEVPNLNQQQKKDMIISLITIIFPISTL